MPISKKGKVAIIVGVMVSAFVGTIAWFRYSKPGVFAPYKCNQGGDSSRKFYDPNWRARGAVCDGFWIPFGAALNGKDTTLVIEKMAAINTNTPIKKDSASMKALAELAASQL